MKILKTASGNKLKLSKKEWESMGKKAGWWSPQSAPPDSGNEQFYPSNLAVISLQELQGLEGQTTLFQDLVNAIKSYALFTQKQKDIDTLDSVTAMSRALFDLAKTKAAEIQQQGQTPTVEQVELAIRKSEHWGGTISPSLQQLSPNWKEIISKAKGGQV